MWLNIKIIFDTFAANLEKIIHGITMWYSGFTERR